MGLGPTTLRLRVFCSTNWVSWADSRCPKPPELQNYTALFLNHRLLKNSVAYIWSRWRNQELTGQYRLTVCLSQLYRLLKTHRKQNESKTCRLHKSLPNESSIVLRLVTWFFLKSFTYKHRQGLFECEKQRQITSWLTVRNSLYIRLRSCNWPLRCFPS